MMKEADNFVYRGIILQIKNCQLLHCSFSISLCPSLCLPPPNLLNTQEWKQGCSIMPRGCFNFGFFSSKRHAFFPQVDGLSQDIWAVPRNWVSKADLINRALFKFLLQKMCPWNCKTACVHINSGNYLKDTVLSWKKSWQGQVVSWSIADASITENHTKLQLSVYISVSPANCKLTEHTISPDPGFYR